MRPKLGEELWTQQLAKKWREDAGEVAPQRAEIYQRCAEELKGAYLEWRLAKADELLRHD